MASQIFFDKNDLSRKFIGRCFFNKNPIKEYDYKDILIRTEFSVSASGLGLHSDEKLAIEHAIFEVIERHVALLLWYKDNEIMLINSRELVDGYFIYNYTNILKIPFCVSVIINKKEDIFFCGSSVKSNLNDAIKAAEVEALSLLGNILIKNTNKPKGNVLSTIDRICSLVGVKAKERILHLKSKHTSCYNIDFLDRNYTVYDLLKIFNFNDVYVIFINRFYDYYCYRVIINGALTKIDARNYFGCKDIVSDPFC